MHACLRTMAALALVSVVAVSASAQSRTGRLSGTVVDNNGGPLPGVTVTTESAALIGGPRLQVTEVDGTFAFPGLDPGEYVIRFELSGFVSQERREVQVRLDRTTRIDVTMPQSTFAEEIRVTAETPVVDPTQVSTSQNFTTDYLSNATVGAANRSYQNVLTQAPGVVGEGNPSVYGSTEGENAYYVDGLDTTDPVTATFGTNFNFDAIQEISFQTGGFEAEYGRATGGVVNLVTKSGGNDFSGTLDVRYRSTSFYENGEHFDRDENRQRFLDPAATFGGPIVRDRVWFFLSGERVDSQTTPAEAPVTRQYEGTNYIGKATWQASPNWRVIGKVSGDPATIDNANADRFVAPESSRVQEQGGSIYQAEVNGIFSAELLWNLQVGVNRSDLDSEPQSGDLNTPGHVNVDTGESFDNYTNAQYSNRDRDEAKTSLTWFVDELGGSHEFKGGVEYNQMTFGSHSFTTGGGMRFEDLAADPGAGDFSPIPYIMWIEPDVGRLEYDGTLQTAYLQDAWRPTGNLTVKLGARWDAVAYENEGGSEIADMDMIQPRVGLAWDVTGDARTLLKASWGRFMHPNALTLPSFARIANLPDEAWLSCSTFIGTVEECQAFVAAREARGYRWRSDPTGWDPAGWLLNPANVFGSAPNQIVSDLEPTYAEELIVGFERELWDRTSVEVSYVDKDTEDIFEDTCNGNLEDPSPDAECDFYVMANLPQLRRDYRGYILRFETRPADWLHILSSYTYSKSRGSVEYTQNAGVDYDIFPAHFINRYGYLGDDRRHRVKLNGYVRLPWDITLGVDSFWSSDFAYNRITENEETASELLGDEISLPYGEVFLDPRGNHRGNSNYQMDLQVAKGFSVGGLRMQVIGAVYNLLDTERATDVCQSANIPQFDEEGNRLADDAPGCGLGEAGDPSSGIFHGDQIEWQDPRRYEVGFRIEL